MERNTDNSARVAGGLTSTGVLTRGQMARALREGSLDEARSGGTGGGVIAGAISRVDVLKYLNKRDLRSSCGCVTLAMLMAATITVAPTAGIPRNSANVPSSGPQPAGSIPRTPSPSVGDGNSVHPYVSDVNQGHQKKMLNKITSVTAAAVVGIAATVAGAQSAAVQWRVEDGGNGHWYQRVTRESRSWSTLREFAERDGGHLATLTSLPETNFLVNTVLSGNFCFIGGFQLSTGSEPAGDWQWVTGEAVRWTNWAVGEPNNYEPSVDEDVMAIWGDGLWADVNEVAYLTSCQHAIIEWSADCNNDSIVDYGQCLNGTLPDYNSNNIPDCCERGKTCVVGNYPVQWKVSDGGNGHWYEIQQLPTRPTCVEAESMAIQSGARPIALETLAENDFFRLLRCSQVNQHLSGWQDLRRVSNQWTWGSGEPFVFQSWSAGQPDSGDTATIDWAGPNGQCETLTWGDENCTVANLPAALFLEWSADCNNDSIVDYGQIRIGQLADTNNNGVPDTCECIGDIDTDGTINGSDLGVLLAYWGPTTSDATSIACDLNIDGVVNGSDLGILLAYWGPCSN